MNLLSQKYGSYLEVLGNTERLKILELLMEKELCVQEINSHLFASQATVSYHLSLLKRAGFVSCVKAGKFIYYTADLTNIKRYLKDFVRDFTCAPKSR